MESTFLNVSNCSDAVQLGSNRHMTQRYQVWRLILVYFPKTPVTSVSRIYTYRLFLTNMDIKAGDRYHE